MVNWDPVALTAISDDEVVHKDTKSHFYHLRYYTVSYTHLHVKDSRHVRGRNHYSVRFFLVRFRVEALMLGPPGIPFV